MFISVVKKAKLKTYKIYSLLFENKKIINTKFNKCEDLAPPDRHLDPIGYSAPSDRITKSYLPASYTM